MTNEGMTTTEILDRLASAAVRVDDCRSICLRMLARVRVGHDDGARLVGDANAAAAIADDVSREAQVAVLELALRGADPVELRRARGLAGAAAESAKIGRQAAQDAAELVAMRAAGGAA